MMDGYVKEGEVPNAFDPEERVEINFKGWLGLALMGLCDSAVEDLSQELKQQYEEAKTEAQGKGLAPDAAEQFALKKLGNPLTANERFKKSHITYDKVQEFERHRQYAEKNQFRFFVPNKLPELLLIASTPYVLKDGYSAQNLLAIFVALFVLIASALHRHKPQSKLTETLRFQIILAFIHFSIFVYMAIQVVWEDFTWTKLMFIVLWSLVQAALHITVYIRIKRIEEQIG